MEIRMLGRLDVVQDGSPVPGLSLEEFANLACSIVVMVPHRPSEGVDGSFILNSGQWALWGMNVAPVDDPFGGEIAATRGNMAKSFLTICRQRPHFKYLVMIDNDQVVEPLHPIQLAMWDEPIVTGVVCSPSEHGILKACFTVKDENGVARFPTIRYTQKLPTRGLMEINSCGTGLICIRRDVIEAVVARNEIPFKIPDAIRDQCWDSGTMKIGEDIAFCRQAQDSGFKIYVDFAVRAVHKKTTAFYWPEQLLDQSLDARTFKVDSRDYVHE